MSIIYYGSDKMRTLENNSEIRNQDGMYPQQQEIEEEATQVLKKILDILEKKHKTGDQTSMYIGCNQDKDNEHEYGMIYYRCNGHLLCKRLMDKRLKYPSQTWERIMAKAEQAELLVEYWNDKPMIGSNLMSHACLWYEFIYIAF